MHRNTPRAFEHMQILSSIYHSLNHMSLSENNNYWSKLLYKIDFKMISCIFLSKPANMYDILIKYLCSFLANKFISNTKKWMLITLVQILLFILLFPTANISLHRRRLLSIHNNMLFSPLRGVIFKNQPLKEPVNF